MVMGLVDPINVARTLCCARPHYNPTRSRFAVTLSCCFILCINQLGKEPVHFGTASGSQVVGGRLLAASTTIEALCPCL